MIRRWLALTYYLYALRLAALSHFYFNRLYQKPSRLNFLHPAQIRTQCGGDIDAAVCVLMVFQQCDQCAAHCQSRAVERVDKAVFAVFVLEAGFHAAGLEIFAVGAA